VQYCELTVVKSMQAYGRSLGVVASMARRGMLPASCWQFAEFTAIGDVATCAIAKLCALHRGFGVLAHRLKFRYLALGRGFVS